MTYVHEIPSLVDEQAMADIMAGRGAIEGKKIFDTLVWTKSHHWQHETERRMHKLVGSGFTAQSDVIKDNPEKGYSQVGFDRDALDSVVFGVSTTEEDRANITDIVRSRYPAVKLFQAHTNAASHKLDIVPVVTESDGRI